MKMHFDAATVRRLIDHACTSTKRAPTMDQMFWGRCRHDGLDVDPEGLGVADWPTVEEVDFTRVPAGLWLVGDQGVYLMSPGHPALVTEASAERNVVAQLEEAGSSRMQSQHEGQHEDLVTALVGDDGKVLILLPPPSHPAPVSRDAPQRNVVAQSEETDSSRTQDWYENKGAAFGGDDGVLFLPANLIEQALSMQRQGRMALMVTPDSVGSDRPDHHPGTPGLKPRRASSDPGRPATRRPSEIASPQPK